MINLRNQLDKIIITAMDRFVWFVLLVVMSHLVTEFTRVTGYTRGNRHDVVLINDTSIQPMILFPGEEYGLYDHQISQYNNIYPNNANKYNSNNNYNNYNSNSNNNNPNVRPSSAVLAGPAANAETSAIGFPFSFRPLIDSIFEIPISTLRAVNNLMARLTGSYHHQVPSITPGVLKSTDGNENPDALQALRALPADTEGATSMQAPAAVTNSAATAYDNADKTSSNNNNNKGNNDVVRMRRMTLLREVSA